MARRKPKPPDIVETHDHGGVHFEIERMSSGTSYQVRFHDRVGNLNTRAPYFSIEEAREQFKQSIDNGGVR